MSEFYYNDGSTWRKAKQVSYNDGGTWRNAKECWYNDAGTWRKVFSNTGIVSPLSQSSSIGDSTVGTNSAGNVQFASNGTIGYGTTGSGGQVGSANVLNWYLPTTGAIGSSYWIRATETVGTLTTNPASTWTALSSSQTFVKGPATAGNNWATVTFEIALDSGGTNIVCTSTGWVIGYTHT